MGVSTLLVAGRIKGLPARDHGWGRLTLRAAAEPYNDPESALKCTT